MLFFDYALNQSKQLGLKQKWNHSPRLPPTHLSVNQPWLKLSHGWNWCLGERPMCFQYWTRRRNNNNPIFTDCSQHIVTILKAQNIHESSNIYVLANNHGQSNKKTTNDSVARVARGAAGRFADRLSGQGEQGPSWVRNHDQQNMGDKSWLIFIFFDTRQMFGFLAPFSFFFGGGETMSEIAVFRQTPVSKLVVRSSFGQLSFHLIDILEPWGPTVDLENISSIGKLDVPRNTHFVICLFFNVF